MGSLSVLVVEDVEDFAEVLLTGLREAGYDVAYARTGAEAAPHLERQRFDLVITDIIMPGKDGFEVIDTVRRFQPDARIFAMSGGGKLYSAHACLEAAESNGIDAVFLKPFSLDSLFAKIDSAFPTKARKIG